MPDLNNTFNLPIPGSPRFESDVAKAISRIRDSLGAGSTPAFGTIEFPGLTASRLVALDADNELTNTDLASWVTGTANRITVADDGDGTITLSGPQDIHTGASPTFAGLTIGSLSGVLQATAGVVSGDAPINALANPTASKTFSMGGNTLTFGFTNPVGGMLFNMTGGWSGHVFEIMDTSVAADAITDHLIHVETSRENVLAGHFVNNHANGRALHAEGKARIDGEITLGDFTVAGFVKNNASGVLSGGSSLDAGDINLVSWVTGTANRITVADDGDGTITLSGPQDIHTGASPTFARVLCMNEDTSQQVETTKYSDLQGSNWAARRARGTAASPASLQDGDRIGILGWGGYTGTGFPVNNSAALEARVDGEVRDGRCPAHVRIGVTGIGETTRTTMLIVKRGGVGIGIGTDTPNETLEVGGKIRALTSFNLNGTDGVTQAAAAGTVCDVTAIAGGITTAQTQITYAADGTYSFDATSGNVDSITITNGRITAITTAA